MRRRSKASSEPAKARGRKLAAPERASGTEVARPPHGSSAAGQHSDIAQLSRELAEARQEQTATADVLHIISSSSASLDQVFKTILENATRICEAKLGNLWLREANGYRNVALHGPPSRYAEWYQREPVIDLREHPRTPLAYLDRTHEVLHITDLATDPAYDRHDRRVVALVESARARTVVIVPMFKENALVGAMAIYRAAVRPFTDKQIALVQNFAAQAVIAIENARLLDELRQRTADLSESLEQQTATSEVLKVISSSPGALAPVFNAIAEPVPGFFAEHGGARTQRIASSIANATAQANALSYTIAHDLSIIVVVLLANVGCALKKPARAPMK